MPVLSPAMVLQVHFRVSTHAASACWIGIQSLALPSPTAPNSSGVTTRSAHARWDAQQAAASSELKPASGVVRCRRNLGGGVAMGILEMPTGINQKPLPVWRLLPAALAVVPALLAARCTGSEAAVRDRVARVPLRVSKATYQ